MKSKIRAIGYSIAGLGFAVPCFAEGLTLPTSVDLSAVLTYGGVIVGALVGMIVLRKAIKLTNRS
jgi:hypothetical protein